MAGSFGDYLENEVIDHILGKGAYTSPTVYIAASTADPTDDGSGMAEPSDAVYARVATSAATWNAASGGSTTNAAAITFPVATESWGTITHFAGYDAATAGNMLFHGDLDTSKSISINQALRFDVDALTVTLG